MSLQNVSDVATSPQAAITTSVSVTTANLLGISLPEIINVCTVVYLALLISHKGWQMYKEWKQGRDRESRE
jgi:hypothetical protein